MGDGSGAGGEAMKFLLKLAVDQIKMYKDKISNADDELFGLQSDECFLNDFIAKNNKIHPQQVKLLRDLVYQIRDEIDKSAVRLSQAKSWFKTKAAKLDVAQNVGLLRSRIRAICGGPAENPTTVVEREEPPSLIPLREDNVVGLEDEAEKIINYLREEKDELDVISIVGMPGLGKSTLAYKIHRDRDGRLTDKFPVSNRIWVRVKPTDKSSDVLRSILQRIPGMVIGNQNLDGDELRERIKEKLQTLGCFLITIDDVWSSELWNDLKEAFPKAQKGKILITSQLLDVARRANRKRDPHKLRFLTENESKELLHLEAFGTRQCPRVQESHLDSVSKKCEGLPHLILGIAQRVHSYYDLELVSENFSSYVDFGIMSPQYRTCSLSYSRIPDRLKLCFLYMGIFPESYPIPVWMLIRLWIAEQFIYPKGGFTLQQAAHDDLVDLVNRNLVMMIPGTVSDNENKLCRVHRMVREFCKYEACYDRENLFQELNFHGGQFLPSISNLINHRRLRVGSNVQRFLSSNPPCSHLSSFICFSSEALEPGNNRSSIPDVLEYLRVLEAKFITYTRSWDDWGKLRLLRHLVLSTNLTVIPKVISKLWSMETLVVHTTASMLKIKANIYSMSRLRHVETNKPTKLPKPGRRKENNIITLGRISDKSCTERVFAGLGSLQKLRIQGQLYKVLKGKSLAKLDSVTKLKLLNESSSSQPSRAKLPADLPNSYKFPENLTSLTLCATRLDWSNDMSALKLLNMLEKLKLKNNAFSGDSWVVDPAGFRKLKVLHIIDDTDLQLWTVHDNSFRALRCLVIINCVKLEEIPFNLAKNSNLKKVCLQDVEQLKSSAMKILQEKRKQEQEDRQSLGIKFKLYIDGNEENDQPDDQEQPFN